jgi:Family of unknown function (DUF5675)
MELTLTRIDFREASTIGELDIEGVNICWTLELPNKDGLPGSCIPQGRYPVVLAPSPKFEQSTEPWIQQYASRMPHIIQIPDRSEIMLHWGNDPADTDGCVLLGLSHPDNQDWVGSSRPAFEKFFALIAPVAGPGQCFLTVIGGARVPDDSADLRSETIGDA